MYTVLLLSAGKGSRMEKEVPKQYLLLAGKPMIVHTLERINRLPSVDCIVIVCEQEYVPIIGLMLRQYGITKKVKFANGGQTRQESVYLGLQMVDSPNVIIHEAARPFVLQRDFQRLIDEEHKNIMFGYPIPFTVVKGDEYITGLLERRELVNVQLPQKFDTFTLKQAHSRAREEGREFTEDASMVFEYTGEQVKIIEGSSINIKVTEPIDLILGEEIYREYITGRR